MIFFSITIKRQFFNTIDYCGLLMNQKMTKMELKTIFWFQHGSISLKFLKMWKKYSNLGSFLVFGLNKFSFDRKVKSLAEKKLHKRRNIIFHLSIIFFKFL